MIYDPVDREIHDELMEIFSTYGHSDEKLEKEIMRLDKKYDSRMYPSLLYILSHLTFSPSVAKNHWKNIRKHKQTLEENCCQSFDFRVALLDYFIRHNQRIKNPKILELQIYQKTEQSAIVDELTGLYNYRYFSTELDNEIKRARRYSHQLSLVIFDIDDFKMFNDKFGHLVGNKALKKISTLIKGCARDVDLVARYGGEEFIVLLPQTSKQGALVFADRLCQKVRETIVTNSNNGCNERITISGGIATFPNDAKDSEALFRCADKALYQAKAHGKNHVQYYVSERRAYARVDSSCIGNFWLLSEKPYQLTTMNISLNGILFATDKYLPLSSLIEIQMKLPNYDKTINCKAKVIRVEETARVNKKIIYEIGVEITEMLLDERKYLESYVRTLVEQI